MRCLGVAPASGTGDASVGMASIASMSALTGLDGVVFEPGNPGFAEEVAGFNAALTHRPALVVGAASEADVVEAVRYAALGPAPGGGR